MKFRRAKWSLALLAVVLNLGGGPMAWAHVLDDTVPAHSPAASEMAPPECHGHADASATGEHPAPAPDSLPCCDGGDCSCAAPALTISVSHEPARLPSPGFIATADTSALPAHPLDDNLRPPIR